MNNGRNEKNCRRPPMISVKRDWFDCSSVGNGTMNDAATNVSSKTSGAAVANSTR
jgi:hypothetical protein